MYKSQIFSGQGHSTAPDLTNWGGSYRGKENPSLDLTPSIHPPHIVCVRTRIPVMVVKFKEFSVKCIKFKRLEIQIVHFPQSLGILICNCWTCHPVTFF